MLPTITVLASVPAFARGFVRDLRPRWAFEEVGQAYAIERVHDSNGAAHRRAQPFGQIPSYRDDEVEIFESGAIVLRIAERAGLLIPVDTAGRMRAVQWVMAALSSIELPVMSLTINDVFEADRDWSGPRHAVVSERLRKRLAGLDGALGDGTWLDGDVFTVGDLMMVSVLGGLRGTDALDPFPRLAAYVARGEARPAHVKAMADHLAVYEPESEDSQQC